MLDVAAESDMLLALQIVPGNGQSPIQVGWARAGIHSYSLGGQQVHQDTSRLRPIR
jgi:hypothetical protein